MNKAEKDLLLQVLNVDEKNVNYSLKNNNVFHMATGIVDQSFLLYSCVKSGLTDFQIVHNKTTDVVSFISHLRSIKNIDFDRYEIINKDLHLFYDGIAYVIKDAGLYLFDEPTYLQMALNENNSGLHTATYRTHKYMTNVGPSLMYRLVYIGYPKIGGYVDDEFDFQYEHSFDAIEELNEKTYFVTDAQLDHNFRITSKYLTPENSKKFDKKLDIYKESLSLITKGFKINEYYSPTKSRITFFIDEDNELDFILNMQFNHNLYSYSALEQIDRIINYKKHFESNFFIHFLSSFEVVFTEYFKKNDFLIDVNITCVDDLLNYRNLMGMAKI
jgi:hypothetical protein